MPDTDQIYSYIQGARQALDGADYLQAIDMYQKVIKLTDNDSANQYRLSLGAVCCKAGQTSQGVRMMRMAADAIPEQTSWLQRRVLRNLGNVYMAQRNWDAAAQAYRKVFQGIDEGRSLFLLSNELESAVNLVTCRLQILKCAASELGVPCEELELQLHRMASTGSGGRSSAGSMTRTSDRVDFNPVDEVKEAFLYVVKSYKAVEKVSRQHHRYLLETVSRMSECCGLKMLSWILQQLEGLGMSDEVLAVKVYYACQQLLNDPGKLVVAQAKAKLEELYAELSSKEAAVSPSATQTRSSVLRRSLTAVVSTNLSSIELLSGNPKKAKELAIDAVTANPYWASGLVALGNAELALGSSDSAADCFMNAAGLDVDCVEAFFNLALTRQTHGVPTEALAVLNKLHSSRCGQGLPVDPSLFINTARCLEGLGNSEEAQRHYSQVASVDDKTKCDASLMKRLAQLQPESSQSSVQYLNESFNVWPHDIEVLCELCKYFVSAGNLEAVRVLFDHLIDFDRCQCTACSRILDRTQRLSLGNPIVDCISQSVLRANTLIQAARCFKEAGLRDVAADCFKRVSQKRLTPESVLVCEVALEELASSDQQHTNGSAGESLSVQALHVEGHTEGLSVNLNSSIASVSERNGLY